MDQGSCAKYCCCRFTQLQNDFREHEVPEVVNLNGSINNTETHRTSTIMESSVSQEIFIEEYENDEDIKVELENTKWNWLNVLITCCLCCTGGGNTEPLDLDNLVEINHSIFNDNKLKVEAMQFQKDPAVLGGRFFDLDKETLKKVDVIEKDIFDENLNEKKLIVNEDKTKVLLNSKKIDDSTVNNLSDCVKKRPGPDGDKLSRLVKIVMTALKKFKVNTNDDESIKENGEDDEDSDYALEYDDSSESEAKQSSGEINESNDSNGQSENDEITNYKEIEVIDEVEYRENKNEDTENMQTNQEDNFKEIFQEYEEFKQREITQDNVEYRKESFEEYLEVNKEKEIETILNKTINEGVETDIEDNIEETEEITDGEKCIRNEIKNMDEIINSFRFLRRIDKKNEKNTK